MRKILSVLLLIGLSFSIEIRVPAVSSASIAANLPNDISLAGTLTANKGVFGSGGVNFQTGGDVYYGASYGSGLLTFSNFTSPVFRLNVPANSVDSWLQNYYVNSSPAKFGTNGNYQTSLIVSGNDAFVISRNLAQYAFAEIVAPSGALSALKFSNDAGINRWTVASRASDGNLYFAPTSNLTSGSGFAALSTLALDDNGNVGIGTTAPSTKLEVAGTTSTNGLVVNGTGIIGRKVLVANATTVNVTIPGTQCIVMINPTGTDAAMFAVKSTGGGQGCFTMNADTGDFAYGTTTNPGTAGKWNVWVVDATTIAISDQNPAGGQNVSVMVFGQ